MSEENEKKQNNDRPHRNGYHNRHRYGKHRGHGQSKQNQQPAEAQNNVSKETKTVEQSQPIHEKQAPNHQKKNHQKRDAAQRNEHDNDKNIRNVDEPNQPPVHQDKENKEGRNRTKNRSNKNRHEGNVEPYETPILTPMIDTSADDDLIFGFSRTFSKKIQTPSFTAEELDEVPKIPDEELFGTAHLYHPVNSSEEGAVEVVSIRFKKMGKSYFFDPAGNKLKAGDYAILDTARGLEFGEVAEENRLVSEKSIVQPLRQVVRIATKDDIERHASNKRKEKEALDICLRKIDAHGLDMKLVDAQYAFDNSKLLFYFTSAGRVDFRELVRDLASVFKTRIELRQIGIRDEAKMLGGIGICGRPLCCSRFLSNFAQVSIKMAKEQGLSLNSGKISGTCGRLMCCLNFENQTYLDAIKETPMPGSIVKIDGKTGTVTEATPLIGMLKVHLQDAPDGETVVVHRDSVTVIVKKGEPADDSDSAEE